MVGTLIRSKLRHPTNAYFEGEDRDEEILYVFRRSFITNLDWMFVTLILLFTPFVVGTIIFMADNTTKALISPFYIFIINVFWYIFTFGYILQNFLNWFFNVYIVTNKRIVDVDFVGFLYKNISEASVLSIEDVTSNVSGALRVLLNYGSVYIQTAAERREFEFTDVANPTDVRDIISDIATAARSGGDVYAR